MCSIQHTQTPQQNKEKRKKKRRQCYIRTRKAQIVEPKQGYIRIVDIKQTQKNGNVTYAQERHIYIQIVEPKQGYIRIVDIKQTKTKTEEQAIKKQYTKNTKKKDK